MNTYRSSRSVLAFALLLLLSVSACHPSPPESAPGAPVTIKILATADVHGWINSNLLRGTNRYEGGLAEIGAAWRSNEGIDPARHHAGERLDSLILDSGDMWTGPPESTLLQGSPLVEAFNAMAYDAGVIGNHEFDFTVEVLRKHAKTLRFPLLCSNVDSAPDGPAVDFCQPSALFNVKGIRIGVIGLSLRYTPSTTFPPYVKGLQFHDYLPELRKQARALMDKGATQLVVIAHEEETVMEDVARQTADLPIRLFLCGHNHKRELVVLERDPSTPTDDVVLLNAGAYGRSYGRIELSFAGGRLVAHSQAIVPIEGETGVRAYPVDPALAAIGAQARARVADRMSESIGQAAQPMEVGTVDFSPLGELVVDSWLEQFPQAQLAIGNMGGIRQPIQAGKTTIGDVFGVLPFANDLMLLQLTPAQLRQVLSVGRPIVGGMRFRYHLEQGKRVVTRVEDLEGHPLQEDRPYPVITTDFLYFGGDGLPLKRMCPQPVQLGVSWRDPVIARFRRRGAEGVTPPMDPRGLPD